jgi:hypothetical protein
MHPRWVEDVNERIERLKTSREAEILAANADRLGAPELALAARARALELRAAERPVRTGSGKRAGAAKQPLARAEGESLYMNGVFESVLQEIELAQRDDPDLVCYLQPYTQAPIKRLREVPPSAAAPWDLFISVTTGLTEVGYQARIVEWRDKTQIPAAELAVLNSHLAATQPGEGAVHLEGKKGQVGLNLIGITRLQRLEPALPVSAFTKISDGLPLKQRTQAGGYSYVLAPAAEAGPAAEAAQGAG